MDQRGCVSKRLGANLANPLNRDMGVMTDGADNFGKMVEVMEAVIIAFKGRHVLEPWSEDEQRPCRASFEAAALWFPVLPDRVTLHMYQAQALF